MSGPPLPSRFPPGTSRYGDWSTRGSPGAAFVMDAASYILGRALAPLLSIAVVHWFGYGWAFAGNAVSFVVFTLILWRAGVSERSGGSVAVHGRLRIASARGASWSCCHGGGGDIADDPVLVLGPPWLTTSACPRAGPVVIAALGGGSVVGSLRRSKHLPSLARRHRAGAPRRLHGLLRYDAVGLGKRHRRLRRRDQLPGRQLRHPHVAVQAARPTRVAAVMAVWAIAWAGSEPLASLTDGLLAAGSASAGRSDASPAGPEPIA